MATRHDAQTLAAAEVAQGYATRYRNDADGVHVETDQGWQTLWTPADDDAPRYLGANDTNPDA